MLQEEEKLEVETHDRMRKRQTEKVVILKRVTLFFPEFGRQHRICLYHSGRHQ